MPSKLWNSMNDLEMVTSKIVSAREILDSAVDRLQEHQYDKVETLINASYEFLEYYLNEFDEKFKIAWQETVVKSMEEDNMPPWGHSDMEALGKAMKHNVEEQNNSWVLPVEKDGDDLVITFPEELIEKTGWKIGDKLEWTDNKDGSFSLIKK